MGIFFAFLLTSFIVSLFCLYHISREDLTFFRRNVTLDDIFNIAFLTLFSGLLFARVFYVVFNFAPGFLNPLVFFLVPYFPGLSLIGGIFGGVVVLLFISRKKRFPIRRILDFIALSFLAGLPIGYVGSLFIQSGFSYFVHLFLPALFLLLFITSYFFVLPRLLTKELKPGMLGTSILIVFSFLFLLISVIHAVDTERFVITGDDILAVILFCASLGYFIKQDLYIVKQKK